jgi:hypothetical protein
MTLRDSKVATRLPAQDLDCARAFDAERLGLEPVDDLDPHVAAIAAGGLEPAERLTYLKGAREALYPDSAGNELRFGGAPLDSGSWPRALRERSNGRRRGHKVLLHDDFDTLRVAPARWQVRVRTALSALPGASGRSHDHSGRRI